MSRLFRFSLLTVACFSVTLLSQATVRAQDPYASFVAPTPPQTPAEQLQKFQLPPGFKIELVASEPLVPKPINLSFDARGRMFVTCSIEYPYPAAPGAQRRDSIKILEDTTGEGRYDRVSTFADGLNIPVGISPTSRGILAYSIPNVDQFLDANDDGRAEERRITYGPFGSADTHGMPNAFTWWIDGWIYGCQGQSNVSVIALAEGPSVNLNGGTTFRMKPDGSRFEPFAFGQVNPFGLCFDPLGNLYTADSNSRPATLLLRGAYYPTLGSPHDGMGFGPELMSHFHGSTGIAGIAYYAAAQFPPEYRESIYIGNPVTGRINHDRIEFVGSTARAVALPDFLKCDDPWFRPVDIQLGPDGALYVADFYNRIIAHTLVPLGHAQRDRERGRIWRISFPGNSQRRAPPNLETVSLHRLLDYLGHANLSLRVRATHQLVERFQGRAVDPIRRLLAADATPWQRIHGLWILHRLDALDEKNVDRLSRDPDASVRVHLVRALAERDAWVTGIFDERVLVLDALHDDVALVRRVAAGALGRHPSTDNVEPLLELWARTESQDTMLVHTVRLALRDTLAAHPNLITAGRYPQQTDHQRRLADVSVGLKRADAAAFLHAHIRSTALDLSRLEQYLHHAVRYVKSEELSAVFATARIFQQENAGTQAAALRAAYWGAEERGVGLPVEITAWGQQLAQRWMTSDQERYVFDGLELVWDLKLEDLGPQVSAIARQSSQDPVLRSLAIDVFGAVLGAQAIQELARLAEDPSERLDIRGKAAETLGKVEHARSLETLSRLLPDAPLEMAVVIARGLVHSREGAEILLDNIAQGKASARLLLDTLIDQQMRDHQIENLDRRLTSLRAGLPPRSEQLQTLLLERRHGFTRANADSLRGTQVWEKHCSICHQLAGKGERIGPALDGVGLRGIDRLLEDTLNPSQNVDHTYRKSVLLTNRGRIVTGLILREENGLLVIADSEGKEQRLRIDDVEERRLSKLSPMPDDVAEKLAEEDFYHLLAFLLQQRTKQEDIRTTND